MRSILKFHNDRTFKIVQFTDLHIGSEANHEDDKRSLHLIQTVVEAEQPDLLVFTGDIIWSEGVAHPEKSFRKVLEQVAEVNVPFALVYGNHDSEENITRQQLHKVQAEYELSLSKSGPEAIHGVGNYSLTIQASTSRQVEAVLYFLDSGALAPDHIGGYEWIHQDQIRWFVSESEQFKSSLPALAFFHIPLPEYGDVWQTGEVTGIKKERVCSPKINSGLFTAMVEHGAVLGTFAGHDHDNDYCGRLHGISLCYGRVGGYHCYGKLQRGARIIRLFEGERRFETWVRLDNGECSSVYTHEG